MPSGNSRIIDAVRVRDQLGRPDQKALFGPFKFSSVWRLRQLPIIVEKTNVTGVAIWDNSNTKWDQAQWDTSFNRTKELLFVGNENNVYIETFDFDTLEAD